MATASTNFYVTGGTLKGDAPSYVTRQADADLYEGLAAGQFCYVLTSRQMGKSSLMVRTAARLRSEAGGRTVILDLTAIGQNLTAEQWYDGLLGRVGRQLDLEDELEDFWLDHERLGPLERWTRSLREVVLTKTAGPVVIFVDEIDAVRSLPFSTDEFFAALRELYNRRTEDAELNRLTFCLLGVATPSDLIRDTRMTPFNIGRRIELSDFAPTEAAPLANGLGRDGQTGARLLQRILYWTNGHPYLTQKLCRAVAEDKTVTNAGGVDRLCDDLFLSSRARESDDNLLFVSRRLLSSDSDVRQARPDYERASLLDLYAQLRASQRVADDDANPLITLLRLSGLANVSNNRLQVRNRIYHTVFDKAWITANMPDAELRRQRAAYRAGLLRAAAIAAVILALVGGLVAVAFQQRNRAEEKTLEAEESTRANRRLLYNASFNFAEQAWETRNIGRVDELLQSIQPLSGAEDLRGIEWHYLNRLANGLLTLRGHAFMVNAVAVSPDGRRIITGSSDNTAKVWDAATGQEILTLKGHTDRVNAIVVSPDGRRIVTGSSDNTAKVWDAATGQELLTLRGHADRVNAVAVSPDGRRIVTGSFDKTVKVWDARTGAEIAADEAQVAGRKP